MEIKGGTAVDAATCLTDRQTIEKKINQMRKIQ
jgi:hypothetical protein